MMRIALTEAQVWEKRANAMIVAGRMLEDISDRLETSVPTRAGEKWTEEYGVWAEKFRALYDATEHLIEAAKQGGDTL